MLDVTKFSKNFFAEPAKVYWLKSNYDGKNTSTIPPPPTEALLASRAHPYKIVEEN